jgi:iron complex transport system substrate-binding protein
MGQVLRAVLLLLILIPATGLNCRAGQVKDQLGREIRVPDKPARLVSLAPSITEIVFALGQGRILQGVTQHCDHPPEIQDLPRIGT